MGRLTERDKSLSESSAFEDLDAFDMIDFNEMVYDKLQEYENLMEELEINNIETLGALINLYKADRQTMQKYLLLWGELKKNISQRLEDYRFEGHIVSPETEELKWVVDKMMKLEEEN